MVSKLMSNILKKKEGAGSQKTEMDDDVPDELPPLAEDVAGGAPSSSAEDVPDELPPLTASAEPSKPAEQSAPSTPEPAQPEVTPAQQTAPQQVPNEPPAELPPIAATGEAGSLSDLDGAAAPAEGGAGGDMPDAIKKAKMAKMNLPPPDKVPLPPSEPSPHPPDMPTASKTEKVEIKTEPIPAMSSDQEQVAEQVTVEDIGFFSNVLDHVKDAEGSPTKLLSGDLFLRMNDYYDLRKEEIKTGKQAPVEVKVKQDLMKNLRDLKIMEKKWHVQKLALEEDMKYLHEREREIQGKIEELKLTANELSMFGKIKPEEYFYLQNGVVLKNLHDLVDVLEVIDEETYRFHVQLHKNDFAEWVRHVFRDNTLSDKLANSKSKNEMLEILENVPVRIPDAEKEDFKGYVKMTKYFWLRDGTVVRNINDLADALRSMDERLFHIHVNKEKNDFANWARYSLRNHHLADKLHRCHTKHDMMRAVELFLK